MKKKNYSFSNARYWNKLVHKFYNLNNKIKKLLLSKTSSKTEVNILLDRLKKLYRKLTQLQVKVGIKVAGTALALLLATSTLNAQDFTYQGNLKNPNLADFRNNSYVSPVFEDLDGDGDLDLYAGSGRGTINVSINDGSNVFTNIANLQADGSDIDVGNGSAPVFVDFDDDGDLDLYIGNFDGIIMSFINNGSGVFTAGANVQADGSDIDVGMLSTPIFVDFDDDGDLDLYVGNYDGTINTFINTGGVFAAGANVQADGSDIDHQGGYSNPVFEDIDDDDDLDLYVTNSYGRITVFTNDGTGTFSDSGLLQADGSDIGVGQSCRAVFVDFDDDDDLDLYIGTPYGLIYTYFNDGLGVFSKGSNFQSYNNDLNIFNASPEFADLDGDGDLDLYAGAGGQIHFFTNNGSGEFSNRDTLQADGSDINFSYSVNPVFANIDGDSDLDLFIGEKYGAIKTFTNNGSNVFNAGANLQADGSDIRVGYYGDPVFADIDNDLDLDLFIGNKDGIVQYYENTGSGVFATGDTLQIDASDIYVGPRSSPGIANFDGDSDLDLFVGNAYGEIVSFINEGSGVFSAGDTLQADGSKIDVGDGARPVFADVDGDGDLDLYVGNNDGNIQFYKNLDIDVKISELPEYEISVFPNPTTGIVNLSFNEQDETYNISIVDISGKIVESFVNINNNNFQIDMSKHDKGLYILKVYNDKAIKTSKIIVE